MKSFNKYFLLPFTAISFLLGGCVSSLTNLTPLNIPENPSSIYTFSAAAKIWQSNIDKNTLKTTIVINGEEQKMKLSPISSDIYEFDYKMPRDMNEVGYYYVLEYDYFNDSSRAHFRKSTEVFKAHLVNRYIIQLESDRAPVGSNIAVVGRGFSSHDVILFGEQEVPIEFASSNALSFIVPSMAAGEDYRVSLRTGQGDIPIGLFRIDSASVNAYLEDSEINSGERTMMLFTIGFAAPKGGLYINLTTNIPESVIMPEVVIPEGARSVNIPLEGGVPGRGTLYVEAPGFETVEVPITVF